MKRAELEVLRDLLARYQQMICENTEALEGLPEDCSAASLIRLSAEAMVNGEKYPLDKMHRWLGFIQGILIARGVTTVQQERDYSRPMFQRLYTQQGIESPTF